MVRIRNIDHAITDLTGSTWKDESNKICIGGTDPFGGNEALEFNMCDMLILQQPNANIGSGQTFDNITFAFWIKPKQQDNDLPAIWYNGNSGENPCFCFELKNKNFYWFSDVNNEGVIASNGGIENGVWAFVEMNFEGNTVRVFVNGKKIQEGTHQRPIRCLYSSSYPLVCIGGYGSWGARDGIHTKSYTDNFCGYLFDFCIIKGVWHKDNYVIPDDYID